MPRAVISNVVLAGSDMADGAPADRDPALTALTGSQFKHSKLFAVSRRKLPPVPSSAVVNEKLNSRDPFQVIRRKLLGPKPPPKYKSLLSLSKVKAGSDPVVVATWKVDHVLVSAAVVN